MIRILTANEPGAVKITIDGRLVGEYVKEVETSVRSVAEPGRQVCLFLRNVFDIDDMGRSLLSRLATEGVQLSAAGLYSSYVVSTLGK
jgi:hypothetical protein